MKDFFPKQDTSTYLAISV